MLICIKFFFLNGMVYSAWSSKGLVKGDLNTVLICIRLFLNGMVY